jgi:AbrB family looped-hinge helix DNA binding protein
MGKSRVTSKFQITLPADVRERVPFRPGEVVAIEATDNGSVVVRRVRKVANPLDHLIGRKPWFPKSIPPEQVDEWAEP